MERKSLQELTSLTAGSVILGATASETGSSVLNIFLASSEDGVVSGTRTLAVSAGACMDGIAGIDLERIMLRNEVIIRGGKFRLRR